MFEVKSRMGWTIQLDERMLTFSKWFKTLKISVDNLETVCLDRSVYDLPILEATLVFRFSSGKVIKAKRLRKKPAVKLFEILTKLIMK